MEKGGLAEAGCRVEASGRFFGSEATMDLPFLKPGGAKGGVGNSCYEIQNHWSAEVDEASLGLGKAVRVLRRHGGSPPVEENQGRIEEGLERKILPNVDGEVSLGEDVARLGAPFGGGYLGGTAGNRQPLGESREMIAGGDKSSPTLGEQGRAEGDGLPEKLGNEGADLVSGSGPSEEVSKGRGAAIGGAAGETLGGGGEEGVGVVVRERDVASQTAPVQLNEIGRMSGGGEGGRWREGKLAGIETGQVK